MRRVVLLLAVVAAVAAVALGVVHDPRPAGLSPTPSPAPPALAEESGRTSAPATPRPSTVLRPQDNLSGAALARAWLRAYLTRSDRDDVAWVAPVERMSTLELVVDLRRAGPDLVGLDELSSWRVAAVRPFNPVDVPVDTASRQVLAYTADVTDGVHTAEKPFILYAYRQDNGRWLVGMVDQPYSSEG